MINGLAITVPVIGRIAIGSTYKQGDRMLPQADDHFTITRQTKQDGAWDLHPMNKVCLDKQTERFAAAKIEAMRSAGAQPEEIDAAVAELKERIRLLEIPVRLMFDDPELNFKAEYGAFDKTGRPLCSGDGKTFMRREGTAKKCGDCATPAGCEFGISQRCKPYARLLVQIDGQTDELGAFIFRTTGWNSIRTLTARMMALKSLSKNRLAGLPLVLKLEAKSTSKSHGSAVFYVDLRVRDGFTLVSAIAEGEKYRQAWADGGIDREAYEKVVKDGLANGMFEDTEEDGEVIVEEFFSELTTPGAEGGEAATAGKPGKRQTAKTPRNAPSSQSSGIEAFQESLAMVSKAYREDAPGAGQDGNSDSQLPADDNGAQSSPAAILHANGSDALLNQPAAGSA